MVILDNLLDIMKGNFVVFLVSLVLNFLWDVIDKMKGI